MTETKIKRYVLEWNVSSNNGKIILELQDDSTKRIEDLNFEKFMALTKVLEKGNAWLKNNNTIYNVFS